MMPDRWGAENDDRRRLNRRELFRFWADDAAVKDDPVAQAGQVAPPGALLNVSRPGMGSFFEIRLSPRVPGAVDLATRALDVIEELENQLTVYRDDSELSLINANAHLAPVSVEPGLFSLLERALSIGRQTGGAYDVAAGALSMAWGFTKGPRRVPTAESLAEARSRTGSHLVRLDRQARTVGFETPGVILNLGSIGKGYAIDKAADVMRAHWWPTSALIHGGRSSVFALGSPPDDFGGRWPIALPDPDDPARPFGTLRLRNRGMGTSGTINQQFEEGGRVYGHILDPRTGEPPGEGPSSVTVLAPTAAEADALSTAFYLLGPGATAEFLGNRPDVGVIFVLNGSFERRHDRLRMINVDVADFEAEFG